jgi:hypothetical protein
MGRDDRWGYPASVGCRVLTNVLLVAALSGCGGSDGTMPGERAGWGAAEALGTADYLGSLAGDGSGSAVLVWIPPLQAPDEGASIVARRFAPATGWGQSQTVAPPGPNTFQSPVAAMDPRGVARALWPARRGLLTSQSTGSSWDAPLPISTEYSSFQALPALGLPAPATALAVWTGGPGSASNVSSNRLDPVLGWVAPETVWGIGASDVSAPALAVASNGLGLLTWAEGRESGARLWWTTFDPHRGWAVGQTVGLSSDARLIYGVRVAFNATGQGVLAWTQDDTVFASRYTTVEGPAIPEAIGRGGCQGLAVDSAGNAIALLIQPLVPLAGLVVRHYRSGRGWDPAPAVLAQDGTGSGALSMDARGNAWVVWANASGLWSSRYLSGSGLQTAQQIATSRFGLLPQVVAEAGGGAIAAWLDRGPDTTTATILAARYVVP